MPDLFDTVKGACASGLWSKGVRLARDQKVLVESRSPAELVLRVPEPGRAIAPTVCLYLEDSEWSCDCGAPADPCQHVAAAVIALQTRASRGEGLPESARARRELEYRFTAPSGRLALERWVLGGDRSDPLDDDLTRLIAGQRLPEDLLPTEDDLAIDRLLGAMLRGDRLEGRIGRVLRHLCHARVTFDGRRVRVLADPLMPDVVVTDRQGGVRLLVSAPPGVRLVAAGVALRGDELATAGETDLCGVRWERLPLERQFDHGSLGELVTELLPELERRLPVRIESRCLPRERRGERPRITFELAQEEGRLLVLPTLVYGDPPRARIDAGRFVVLGGEVPLRDEPAERDLVAALRDELNLVPGRRIAVGGREADRLIDGIRRFAGRGEEPRTVGSLGMTKLIPRILLDGDRFAVSFVTEPPAAGEPGGAGGANGPDGATVLGQQASAEAVIGAWREGLGVVPLEGGGWAPLPSGWLERFGDQVADLLAARQPDGTVATAVLPALGRLCAELDAPPPPSLARLRPLLEGFAGLSDATLPAGLRAELRPYQRAGVGWLAFLRDAGLGGVLADDMGLGKTLQALSVLERPSLVVAPKSVLFNWADEIAKFRPNLRVLTYHGPERELADADITLTTYAVMRLDIERLAAREWAAVVLDEAQVIKNPDSQVAQAAYRLRAAQRLCLSGTPVENRLEELWSEFHFTNPGLLGGRRDFAQRYAEPIASGDAVALARLRDKVKPFVLRRLKREVAPDLPPRTEHILYVELEPEERDTYDAVRAAVRQDVAARLEQSGNVLAALEALLRLRQAACHPALLPGRTAATSSKVERLLFALEDAAADGHKALVFSQWTSLLDLVEPHLEQANVPFLRLDGSTRDRGAVVARFQDPLGPPVLVASLKAGGTGLNLTAADHVFLLDPWWNPAVEDQAADRAHRIGQERPVLVHRLVARDTVEEGILALQERKRALAASALGSGDAALGITREELLALLD
ncbi:MAG: DEAD/DEAH box helicase [Polyangiaceae bacterium]|nr:DEAD/DEAH box helicase [Polyangiaceae bacterium]